MQRFRARGLIAWMVLIAYVPPQNLWAQPNEAALARADTLFNEARAMMEQGKYDAACPKLEESQKLDPALGTLFNLADCYEHTFKTATAWAGFLLVAEMASKSGQLARAQLARDRAAALEPKLSKIRIVVPASAAIKGLIVRRNGVVVDPSTWNMEVPLDPGKYLITASAPGRALWSTVVLLKEQRHVESVTVRTHELTESRDEAENIATPRKEGGQSKALIVSGIAMATAAAGLGVTSIFIANAKASERDANLPVEDCVGNRGYDACKHGYDEANDNYVLFANMALWSLVGAGVTGTGTALYAAFTSRASSKVDMRAIVSVGFHGGNISLQSSW